MLAMEDGRRPWGTVRRGSGLPSNLSPKHSGHYFAHKGWSSSNICKTDLENLLELQKTAISFFLSSMSFLFMLCHHSEHISLLSPWLAPPRGLAQASAHLEDFRKPQAWPLCSCVFTYRPGILISIRWVSCVSMSVTSHTLWAPSGGGHVPSKLLPWWFSSKCWANVFFKLYLTISHLPL